MAAKAGATFASPFVGRLDDISTDGMELIEQICTIYRNYGFDTQVLVASVRHPIHVVSPPCIGADVVTLPANVMQQLAKHPLTDIGLERFLADWEKVKNRLLRFQSATDGAPNFLLHPKKILPPCEGPRATT